MMVIMILVTIIFALSIIVLWHILCLGDDQGGPGFRSSCVTIS